MNIETSRFPENVFSYIFKFLDIEDEEYFEDIQIQVQKIDKILLTFYELKQGCSNTHK